jgi:hypothetical protein
MAWTSPQDVKDRWLLGEVPVSDSQLAVLIGDAEDTVGSEFADIQARIDALLLPLVRVQKVVARMVIRHVRNPEGIRQVSEGTGPFTGSRTYGGDEPGAMYLTDEDRAELSGAKTGQRAFTIDTTPTASPYSPLFLPPSPSGWL